MVDGKTKTDANYYNYANSCKVLHTKHKTE